MIQCFSFLESCLPSALFGSPESPPTTTSTKPKKAAIDFSSNAYIPSSNHRNRRLRSTSTPVAVNPK